MYTAYFLGEEIRTPLETVTPAPETSAPPQAGEETADRVPGAEETPEPAPTETPQKDGETNNNLAWLAIIPLLMIFAGGAVYFIMKRKVNINAKTDNPVSDAADSGDDGDSGICG
jgi:uncharacterized protein HemX